MRKSIFANIIIMCLLLVACTVELEDKNTAFAIGETFDFNGFNVVIEEVYLNPLETPLQVDEVVLYIYIDYPEDKIIRSQSVWLHTMNFKRIDYYRVDGLDYLGGVQRADRPFVRFSVSINENEFILYLDLNTRILISIGGN